MGVYNLPFYLKGNIFKLGKAGLFFYYGFQMILTSTNVH